MQKSEQKAKQITFVISIQKIRYSYLRTILLVSTLTSLGIIGRVALQFVPSVEPLIPLSILSGFLFGPIAGLVSGASGFYVSNFFVIGWQGPWTIFQCIGAGLAGMIGGLFGKISKKSRKLVLLATILGIGLYEIIITFGMGIMFYWFMIPLYFLTSIPFMLVHIISSIGFSLSFFEFKEKIKKLRRGKIIGKEIFGFGFDCNSNSKYRNKIIPRFYFRTIFGKDKSKYKDRFWIKRKRRIENS